MLEISPKTNLLEQKNYRYALQDVAEPNLYRDIYDYESVPKVPFNHRRVPMGMPEEIWISDTSFRDGQQSVDPYTVDQIVELYKLMSKLGGPYGIIRQTEFFIYSKKDREAVARCQDLGHRFPEITTWIRATKEDFKLVKDLGIRETGILVSSSDYHIFKKMKLTRSQAMKKYLETVALAFEAGVMPRCHLEDITRADFYGFVVPFVNELMKMSQDGPKKRASRSASAPATRWATACRIPRSPCPAACRASFTACSIIPTCRASTWNGTATTIFTRPSPMLPPLGCTARAR